MNSAPKLIQANPLSVVGKDLRDLLPSNASQRVPESFSAPIDNAIYEFMNFGGAFHGVYNPNSFRVRFEGRGADRQLSTHLDIYAKSVNIPGKNITSQDLQIYGPVIEMPTGVSYTGDIDIVFTLTQDFYAFRWFSDWMSQIVGETTSNLNYYDNYKTNLMISPVVSVGDGSLTETMMFLVEDVWPKTLSLVELNQSSQNQTAEFTVSLSFRKWHYIQYGPKTPERPDSQ